MSVLIDLVLQMEMEIKVAITVAVAVVVIVVAVNNIFLYFNISQEIVAIADITIPEPLV